jgi:hypothetical protein
MFPLCMQNQNAKQSLHHVIYQDPELGIGFA